MSATIATTATAIPMNQTKAPPPWPTPKRNNANAFVSASVMI